MKLDDALRLVFIVDAETAERGDHLDAALGGGVTAVWLREPDANGRALYRVAKQLVQRCHAHGAAVIVGGRADVALAAGADGVQLGHRAPPAHRVRPWFDRWLGVSCHGSSELRHAQEAGADYAVLSPVYGVPEKGTPLGTKRFAALRAAVPELPVVGLGGVETDTADEVRAAGASGVAVIRALRDAADPAATARSLSAP